MGTPTRHLFTSGLTSVAALRLLARMRRELATDGALSRPTATSMYGLYATHAALVVSAARKDAETLPLPRKAARPLGAALAAAGAALTLAGMSRFASARHISGLDDEQFVPGGIYRYSRNPQYVGYVLGLVGLGLARRSARVLAFAVAYGAVIVWWVPVEERHLEAQFGQAYRDYRGSTSRWLWLRRE